MGRAELKEVTGKTIEGATLWPDDEGCVSLQIDFTDGDTLCINLNPPKLQDSLEIRLYPKSSQSVNNGKDLTARILKRAK